MNHAHKFDPLYTSPFHVVPGAAWAVEYCRCGARQDHLINPNGGVPEEQPLHPQLPKFSGVRFS